MPILQQFESKFLADERARDAMTHPLRGILSPDAHGDAVGQYRIWSVYYDSPDFGFLRAQLRRDPARLKVRLRVYTRLSGAAIGPSMVELKVRTEDQVTKHRIPLPLGEAECLLRGEGALERLDPADQSLGRHIDRLVRVNSLRPVCAVAYRRQAFMGRFWRMTFDTDLVGWRPETPELKSRLLPAGRMIVEVKGPEHVPNWLEAALAAGSASRVRFSKYYSAATAVNDINMGVESRSWRRPKRVARSRRETFSRVG